jgi:hypothetical protein
MLNALSKSNNCILVAANLALLPDVAHHPASRDRRGEAASFVAEQIFASG